MSGNYRGRRSVDIYQPLSREVCRRVHLPNLRDPSKMDIAKLRGDLKPIPLECFACRSNTSVWPGHVPRGFTVVRLLDMRGLHLFNFCRRPSCKLAGEEMQRATPKVAICFGCLKESIPDRLGSAPRGFTKVEVPEDTGVRELYFCSDPSCKVQLKRIQTYVESLNLPLSA